MVDLFMFHAIFIIRALQSGRKLGRKLRPGGFGGSVTSSHPPFQCHQPGSLLTARLRRKQWP